MRIRSRNLTCALTRWRCMLCAVCFVVVGVASADADQIRISCVGTSVTLLGQYPLMLQFDIGGRFVVQNAGSGGRTVLNSGFPWDLLDSVQAFKPQLIFVELGTNDSKAQYWDALRNPDSQFVADYNKLIDSLSAISPRPRILLCLPTPAWTNSGAIRDSVIKNRIVPLVRQVAQQHSFTVVDFRMPFLGDSTLFPDGVHPSVTGGGAKMAMIVDSVVRTICTVQPDLALHASVTTSGAVAADQAASMLVDSDWTTKWCDIDGGPKWVALDLKKPTTVDNWCVVNAGLLENARYNTVAFALQSSDNGSAWNTLDSVTGNTSVWVGRMMSPVSAMYFRLYVTDGCVEDGRARIYSFCLYNVGNGTTPVAASGVARRLSCLPSDRTARMVTLSGRAVNAMSRRTAEPGAACIEVEIGVVKKHIAGLSVGGIRVQSKGRVESSDQGGRLLEAR
jgi:acyl-CoA thioesterase I